MVPKLCKLITISSIEISTHLLYSSDSLLIEGGTIHSKEKSFLPNCPSICVCCLRMYVMMSSL